MRLLFIIINLLLCTRSAIAQDPMRFKDEVEKIKKSKYDSTSNVILFTGSSSIRMWDDLQSYFPEKNIVNSGFGGSHMSDLIYFYETLILRYKPQIVFVYEGDNDIAAGKNVAQILADTEVLVNKIKKDLPETEIILISAKPSIARWNLRNNYLELNEHYRKLAEKTNNLRFADVWSIMLSENGQPKKDIFLEDKLHMNKQGYDLWAEKIIEYFD